MATTKDVKLDKPVQFWPYYENDGQASPIEGTKPYIMEPIAVQAMIKSLIKVNRLNLIEESLQGLSVRSDGTNLKTAMPLLTEVKSTFSLIDTVPAELSDLIQAWELQGANEIHIDFEER